MTAALFVQAMKKHLFIFIALSLLGLPSVHAEVMVGCSIEWLACEAEVIAVGKIASTTSVKGPGDVTYEDCVFSVTEHIKGMPAKELKFCHRRMSAEKPAWTTSKSDLLVFLSVHKTGDARLNGLLMPLGEQQPFPIFELSNIQKGAYSTDMTILTSQEAILGIVRSWASSKIEHFLWVPVPPGSPIERTLFAGSSVFLKVPAEEKYRAQFMSMVESKDPYQRRKAARELAKYSGPETERTLRKLLDDDTQDIFAHTEDTIVTFRFSVRQEALRSLKILGTAVPDVTLERKPTDEERRSLRASVWRKHFTSALTNEWNVSVVEDGSTRVIEECESTAVIVTCTRGEARCRFTLVPKEWTRDLMPKGDCLGLYRQSNGNGRQFYFEGSMPAEERENLRKFFGLEKID